MSTTPLAFSSCLSITGPPALSSNPTCFSTAIADTGSTGHFLTAAAAPALTAPHPHSAITVSLPDGSIMQSESTAALHIPPLSDEATTAHVFPALHPHSLLSIGQLCDDGCTATFTAADLTVTHDDDTVLTGHRDPRTRLWYVPIQVATPSPIHTALAVHHHHKTAELVAWAHAALFSPALSTLRNAVARNFVPDFPGLSAASLRQHPPTSVATIKGHLDQVRQNIRPTNAPILPLPLLPMDPGENDTIESDAEPPQETITHHCFAALLPTQVEGHIHTDQTGRFPFKSSRGHTQILVLYDYDSNSIHAQPMPSKSAGDILKAFKTLHNTLVVAGLRPKLQRLDNECSAILQEFLHAEDISFQLVPPGIHRANSAERAIRTFKNHFLAGLCSTDPEFPIDLWDRLLPQAILTLNLLRGSRINPKLSAHAQVFGQYSYNTTPIGPPGTHLLVHEKPANRPTWAPHAVDAWYLGPAVQHYRCYRTYIWSTKTERISDTVEWKPKHVLFPHQNVSEQILSGTQQIIRALQTSATDPSPVLALTNDQGQALQQLCDILAPAAAAPSTPAVAPPSTSNRNIAQVLRVPKARAAILPMPPLQPAPTPSGPLLRVPPIPTPPSETPWITVTSTKRKKQTAALAVVQSQQSTQRSHPTRRRRKRQHRTSPRLHVAAGALHCDTGNQVEYRQLLQSTDGHLWEASAVEEWARLAQGLPSAGIPLTAGTNTIRFITYQDIPAGRKATYPRIVVADRPQKAQTRRVRVTVGGDKIDYPGNVSTKTADLQTAKILFNSVISTPGAKFMSLDIKDFYLNTPMARPEYLRVALKDIPSAIIAHYGLDLLAVNGFVYCEINKGMYGLPQAGILANDDLVIHLRSNGYVQSSTTPGLFLHQTRPISFCLVVDDFGVKYVGEEHAQHLIHVLEQKYIITTDWSGDLYVGLHLDWDYTYRTVDISMPDYVAKALQRCNHSPPAQPQHSPHICAIPQYGAKVQLTPVPDNSPPLTAAQVTHLQQVIGTFLYYARAVDSTMLVTLGSLAAAQSKATTATLAHLNQFLDYASTHPDAKVRFTSSPMVLNIHSDASYLSESQARSRAGGIFFLSTAHDPNTSSPLNGAIHITSVILKHVMASAAEAELAALFYTAQDACSLRETLSELGHPQPPTAIQTDNECAEGIANDTVKQRRSKAMDMRFYWIRDRIDQMQFIVHWKPGTSNHGDYFTKHHPSAHHQALRYTYLQGNSPIL